MPRVILASTSPYRRQLLERLGIAFSVQSPDVDEAHLPAESPRERALRLAAAKADAVARCHPDTLVIGSDQVASAGELVPGEPRPLILDKPGTAARAREQLAALSGRTARFHTACAVVEPSGFRTTHVDETRVVFRRLTADEIERYVRREQPLDCAGGFKAEGLGIGLFERIESEDPTALIGLPLIWLAAALRRLGHAVP